ncbi:MAG: tRNA preQ1(34) S-adenosylmethionine ribosyltransferase-isomerase QueA [Candidatus Delongbacteria bacterium]|jgi:S-adenosylmethionine:tRNA ribosyltransferase-isomerase|nr:tRNA preQ1(34) S-adenosylmethionine ribosyltransferase-isomerase QueA [Candidatus Delongbacteria bacterium]MDY0016951.1 tRNA preQ1(34) S-adenosylmethionine ribosyltransferase-isomerase QueA [Candidatus Delongbacteria bacterium]
MYEVSDYDYELPRELIAQKPTGVRDQSRLLVLNRDGGDVNIINFKDIKNFFSEGDVLVLNETKVLPARLYGISQRNSAEIELLLLKEVSENVWEVMIRPGRKVRCGDRIVFEEGVTCCIQKITEEGNRIALFETEMNFFEFIEKYGHIPLPPYIERKDDIEDKSRYQTVYAKIPGAVAAPTAGLHFTNELLDELKGRGVEIVYILLHVGAGTFKPIKTDRVTDHKMHKEFFNVSEEAAEKINEARRNGNKIFAVGTTVARALESVAEDSGLVKPGSGETEIFIYPGYRFKVIDRMITNFHLPKSTLILLVSAFSSIEMIKKAYITAVNERMRFFSYGDAMLII